MTGTYTTQPINIQDPSMPFRSIYAEDPRKIIVIIKFSNVQIFKITLLPFEFFL